MHLNCITTTALKNPRALGIFSRKEKYHLERLPKLFDFDFELFVEREIFLQLYELKRFLERCLIEFHIQ